MIKFFKNIFGKYDYESLLRKINDLEPEIEKLTDEELRAKSFKLKASVDAGDSLDDILPDAFALVREAAKRTLGQRHYNVQLIGGIVLHQGKIAEMLTGEGKTLASTAPAYLNALAGKGVHIITVNDYLARRDVVWMGQIYHALGLSVGCLTHESAYLYDPNYTRIGADKRGLIIGENHFQNQSESALDRERDQMGGFKIFQEFLRPVSRREAYLADITYGTNHEFGFDYLRDNLAYNLKQQVQRRLVEQRLSFPAAEKNQRKSGYFHYAIIDEVDSILIDEARTPLIIAVPDAESSEFYKIMSRAARLLEPEKDYTVDEKAKHVAITDEGIDKIENFLKIKNLYAAENLRLVHYLEESLKAKALFHRDKHYVVKGGEVIIVDEFTGRLMYGRRYSGGLHQAIEAKEGVAIKQESRTFAQITIQNYFRMYEKLAGMTGTAQTSAEEFDKVYKLDVVSVPPNRPMIRKDLADLIYKNKEAKYEAAVKEIKRRHEKGQPVLVGTASIEHNEIFSAYLTRAGLAHEVLNAKNHEREGAIIAQAGKKGAITVATNMAGRGVDIVLGGNPPDPEEAAEIKALGGLHIIGTERHEARRIDNQLRGRSGRQGDPGSSQFFLSLEDDLLRIFGGAKIKSLMENLNISEDEPIESNLVSRVVTEAQKKIEGLNFDLRKHLLEYDDVLNKQRTAVYRKRQELLESGAAPQILGMLDALWMNHLEEIEALRESVGIRAYGQHEPIVEFRRESHQLFQQMFAAFDKWIEENKAKLSEINEEQKRSNEPNIVSRHSPELALSPPNLDSKKIGRNDPCPCGSGKKYKKCHGV